MTLSPLRRQRDYEAARERLDEIEDSMDTEDALFDGPEEEIAALESLIEDYEAREGADEDEEDDDFELAGGLGSPEPERIARFRLSNGNQIDFLAEPFGSEVHVVEMTGEGSEDLILGAEDAKPAALFARLSNAYAPVPRAIARLDRIGLLEGRATPDVINEEIGVDLARFGIATPAQAAGQSGSCQSGAAGTAYFQTHHCGTGGGPGYGKSESYCFPGAHSWIQKTTSSGRRATYSRMAACGSSTCWVRHFYKTVSGYHTQLLVSVTPPHVAHSWSYKKGVRRKRRVRFERLGSNAIVRGWVRFHSQVADWSV
jgi:hypothetical protein